jgi:hypothetical protein
VRRHVDTYTRTSVRSAAVKKANPALYEAARTPSLTLQIAGGGPPAGLPKLRPYGIEVAEAMAVVKQRRHHANAAVKAARERLADVSEGLRAELGWDGTPIYSLTDGWDIGWSKGLRFNASRATELAPQFGVDPATLVTMERVAARMYFVILEAGQDEQWEDFEGDIAAD